MSEMDMTDLQARVDAILAKPYARTVRKDGDVFAATIAEFEGCIAVGDTAVEALEAIERVADGWLHACIENGTPIPEPHEEPEYSGRLLLRIPRSLHARAAQMAARESVSLNHFVVAALAEHLGATRARDEFLQIAANSTNWVISSAHFLEAVTSHIQASAATAVSRSASEAVIKLTTLAPSGRSN